MIKIKKIFIFLSAIFLVVIGNKKNTDFTEKNNNKNNLEVLEDKNKPEVGIKKNKSDKNKRKVKKEADKKERATASK